MMILLTINDFRFMWRGKHIAPLRIQDSFLLAPIEKRGSGRNKALLLLHGFSSSPAVFRALLPDLTHYDAIVCPVLPGHAESVASFAHVRATDWLDAASEACAALVAEYALVDVVGLSLGGLLACHLSQRFKLNRLYLLAPALSIKLNVPATLLLARTLYFLGFRSIANKAGNLLTNAYQELAYRQLPIATIIEMLTFVQQFKFVAPTCQTELFLGRFDDVVDSYAVEKLFANLPNAAVTWLEHSAHVLPLDGDIEVINAVLRS